MGNRQLSIGNNQLAIIIRQTGKDARRRSCKGKETIVDIININNNLESKKKTDIRGANSLFTIDN